jgi:hypothetical protein
MGERGRERKGKGKELRVMGGGKEKEGGEG